MKKLRSKAGVTLIETLCALLILVFLVLGMGVGMDAGTSIYRDAMFESEVSSLSGILNTTLGDILRYSIRVKGDPDHCGNGDKLEYKLTSEEKEKLRNAANTEVHFVFTSLDYGIQDAYFYLPLTSDAAGGGAMRRGSLKLRSLKHDDEMDLINEGAYPNLEVANFSISYSARSGVGVEGGYYEVSYTILDKNDHSRSRDVECIVRQMND